MFFRARRKPGFFYLTVRRLRQTGGAASAARLAAGFAIAPALPSITMVCALLL
jgi:hypothetical protein